MEVTDFLGTSDRSTSMDGGFGVDGGLSQKMDLFFKLVDAASPQMDGNTIFNTQDLQSWLDANRGSEDPEVREMLSLADALQQRLTGRADGDCSAHDPDMSDPVDRLMQEASVMTDGNEEISYQDIRDWLTQFAQNNDPEAQELAVLARDLKLNFDKVAGDDGKVDLDELDAFRNGEFDTDRAGRGSGSGKSRRNRGGGRSEASGGGRGANRSGRKGGSGRSGKSDAAKSSEGFDVNDKISVVGSETVAKKDGGKMKVDVPKDMQEGDLMVLHLTASDTNTLKAPDGWTKVDKDGSKDLNHVVFIKEYEGEESVSINTSRNSFATLTGLRGVDLDDPVVDTASREDTEGGAAGKATAPSVDTSKNGIVLHSFAFDDPHRAKARTGGGQRIGAISHGDDGAAVFVRDTDGSRSGSFRVIGDDGDKKGGSDDIGMSIAFRAAG